LEGKGIRGDISFAVRVGSSDEIVTRNGKKPQQ